MRLIEALQEASQFISLLTTEDHEAWLHDLDPEDSDNVSSGEEVKQPQAEVEKSKSKSQIKSKSSAKKNRKSEGSSLFLFGQTILISI